MRACMFVTTDVTSDPRVMKEATALAQMGYSVHVLGVRRTGAEPPAEALGNVNICRLDLWHLRFVRWLKSLHGLSPTQGMFTDVPTQQVWSRSSRWRWVGDTLHQIQDIVHLIVVLCSFFFSALRQPAVVYHAHDVDTLLPALFIGKLHKKPVIYDAHEYWYGQSGRVISHAIVRMIELVCIPHCSYVLTVNRSIAEQMARHYQIQVPTVLMNVPSSVIQQQPPLLCNDQRVELLYLGGFFNHRGLEVLIRAMIFVRTPVHLTMRGYGEIESSLRALVDSFGLQSKITFAPPVLMDQIVQSAVGYHVGILPFERDSVFYFSLPNKLFEYMAAGLAILTNELPEIAAIVRKHEIGIVYGSEDPALLAQAIDELAGDRFRLEQYRQKAWKVYHEYYTWDQHQHVLLGIYTELTRDGS